MTVFQDSLDELNDKLKEVENERDQWPSVADLIIENLQKEIDKVKVSRWWT